MQFNLKQYITEKYLTEKLLSDTLVHELMADKGGMFTYYKLPYKGTIYQKALELHTLLNTWITHIFTGWKNVYNENNTTINGIKLDTPDKMKKFHKLYMEKVDEYIDLTSKLFIKPDPQILSSLCNGHSWSKFDIARRDLYNINDECFSRYTWKLLKKDKQLQTDVTEELNNNIAFWMSDGKILAVSKNGLLILYAVDNECEPYVTINNGRRFTGILKPETIEAAVLKDNLIVNTMKCTLSDGTELEWPTVGRNSIIGDKPDLCGIDFVNKFLNLNTEIPGTTYGTPLKWYKIGKFISHGSPLAKATNWGDNENDYVIIYTPEEPYKVNNTIKSTWFTGTEHKPLPSGKGDSKGYNDMKAGGEFNNIKSQRKKDFASKSESVYKWVKTILGEYEPYAGGKNSKMFEFGKKLSEYDYESLYGTDDFCNKIALANMLRYKFIIQQNKSVIGSAEFRKTLDDIAIEMKSFANNGKVICMKIKTVFAKEPIRFKELVFLYGTYMNMFNLMLSKYGNILKRLDNFKKEHNAQTRSKYLGDDTHEEIKRDRDSLKRDIEQLEINCAEMKELSVKIKTTLDE